MSELEPEYTLPPAQPFQGGAWEWVPCHPADWPAAPPRPVVFRVGRWSINPALVAIVEERAGEAVVLYLGGGAVVTLHPPDAARFRELWAQHVTERR